MKASSSDEVDVRAYDLGVDMSEEEIKSMLQEKGWVENGLAKDGGACAW